MTQSTATSKQKTKDPKRYEKVITRSPKCIRCGVCCIVNLCDLGEISKETGICSSLVIHEEGHTSCKFIEENGNIFTTGCLLRRDKKIYKHYKNMAEEMAGVKLVGITATRAQAKSSGK